jgi:hypothetical protein
MDAEEAFSLWLIYVTAALANTEGRKRIVISYEDYFDDWRVPVGRLARFAGGQPPPEGSDASHRIESTIKDSLRHHRTPPEAAWEPGRVPPEVASMYSRVSRLAAASPAEPEAHAS